MLVQTKSVPANLTASMRPIASYTLSFLASPVDERENGREREPRNQTPCFHSPRGSATECIGRPDCIRPRAPSFTLSISERALDHEGEVPRHESGGMAFLCITTWRERGGLSCGTRPDHVGVSLFTACFRERLPGIMVGDESHQQRTVTKEVHDMNRTATLGFVSTVIISAAAVLPTSSLATSHSEIEQIPIARSS